MDKNPFLKYVMKDEKEDIFHSSAYGKAQNGQGIGSASTESFSTRHNIDANRTIIKKYNDSRIATNAFHNAPHAKTYTPPPTSPQPSPASKPSRPQNFIPRTKI